MSSPMIQSWTSELYRTFLLDMVEKDSHSFILTHIPFSLKLQFRIFQKDMQPSAVHWHDIHENMDSSLLFQIATWIVPVSAWFPTKPTPMSGIPETETTIKKQVCRA